MQWLSYRYPPIHPQVLIREKGFSYPQGYPESTIAASIPFLLYMTMSDIQQLYLVMLALSGSVQDSTRVKQIYFETKIW